ncbi:hypothetical protein PHJA_001847100 [Phtheirospermum japonicum]|uniref:Uncharacterized protein n=1 Tax=Phtheirospermum japonicum TaxID=374723 RepID=A0A830CBN6_9LAMI|nr:hypothetical protein PHJA_001847100 [Phtheirospermum japonicum]
MENQDTEERKHRLAQFLIYKAMKKADIASRKRPSWLRVKMLKLKIKIGHRLKILKKGFSSTAFSAKADFCKQMSCALKSCKHLLVAKQVPIVRTLPPAMF